MIAVALKILFRPVVSRLHRRLDALEARLVDVHANMFRRSNGR